MLTHLMRRRSHIQDVSRSNSSARARMMLGRHTTVLWHVGEEQHYSAATPHQYAARIVPVGISTAPRYPPCSGDRDYVDGAFAPAGGGVGRRRLDASGDAAGGGHVPRWRRGRDRLAALFRRGPPAEVDCDRDHSPGHGGGTVRQPVGAPPLLGNGAALVRDQGPSGRGARPPVGLRGRRAAEPLRVDRPGGVERGAGGSGAAAAAVPAPARPGGFVPAGDVAARRDAGPRHLSLFVRPGGADLHTPERRPRGPDRLAGPAGGAGGGAR